jgi:hypothetical protein
MMMKSQWTSQILSFGGHIATLRSRRRSPLVSFNLTTDRQ